jgi:chemotaxis protein MotB
VFIKNTTFHLASSFFSPKQSVILLMCTLVMMSGCVSKEAFQQAVDKNATLNNEMAVQRQQIAQLQAAAQNLTQHIENKKTEIEALQQQNIEAMAELERQSSIYGARTVASQQKIDQLNQQQQALEQERQRTEERFQELQVISEEKTGTISELENNLELERLAREARIAELAQTYDTLVASLEDEIHRGEVTISKLKNRLTVNLAQKILFPSGSAGLSSEGQEVIAQVGEVLKGVADKTILVEGHSDNFKISQTLQQKFPSNWELSAARAASVVRYLQSSVGIAGKKLSIGAYGPYRPIADNATEEGRAQNRRIQIILVPRES